MPQADDFGEEKVQIIQCDVPQRTRLFPDDPNCVERSFGALMLLEVLDPKTPRALATVDNPLRHTGLVEQIGGRWRAVDLFPRRNATARNFDYKSLLVGVEEKGLRPVAKLYLGDAGANAIDFGVAQQNKLLGIKKPNAPEKQPTPSPAGSAQRAPEPAPGARPTSPVGGAPSAPLARAGAESNDEGSGTATAWATQKWTQQAEPRAGQGAGGRSDERNPPGHRSGSGRALGSRSAGAGPAHESAAGDGRGQGSPDRPLPRRFTL